MSKKVLIVTGGTGGHIYPALGLAEELASLMDNCSIHLAGDDLQKSPFLNTVPYALHSIPAARFHVKNVFHISKGIGMSLKLLSDLKPDTVVGFGSFHTFPLLVAACIKKIPFVLHEGNAIPGKVNKLMSRFSSFTAVQFPDAMPYLKGEKKEALLPLRKNLQTLAISPEAARESLRLDPSRFTILIFGGSLGATFLNRLMEESLPLMNGRFYPLQFIHITGNQPEQCQNMLRAYQKSGWPHFVASYHHDMGTLWKAADLCISRSGASTLREMIAFEVPSILIPYPFATENHQVKNAAFLSKRVGGAFMALQHEFTSHRLVSVLNRLFSHKMATYRAMRQALKSYKKRVERQSFAEMIKEVIQP